jgi:hypothetical protein
LVIQEMDTFYLGGDICTWHATVSDGKEHRYNVLVDSSAVATGGELIVYDGEVTWPLNHPPDAVYKGYSKVKYNSLNVKGRVFGFTFTAGENAPPAAGPMVKMQAIQDEKGLSSGQVASIVYVGTALLIVSYIALALFALWRFKKNAERARQAEQALARCAPSFRSFTRF